MRMQTTQAQRLAQQMQLRLTPQMIQAMEILQMPWLALQTRLAQEMQENPMLELASGATDADAELEPPEPRTNPNEPTDDERPLVVKEGADHTEDFARLDAMDRFWPEWVADDHTRSRAAGQEMSDRKQDAMLNVAARAQSLQEFLLEQLVLQDCPGRVRALAEAVIASLNDHGCFEGSLDEMARQAGASLEEMQGALAVVQSLEPAGIGAGDLPECLRLQLDPDDPLLDLKIVLIDGHLEDIRDNRMPAIEKDTGYDMATIKKAVDEVRQLDPRPGARYTDERTVYVVPEVIVEPAGSGYEVRLRDDAAPQPVLSVAYERMLRNKKLDRPTRGFLQRKLESARWLIDAVEQRRRNVLQISRAIVDAQRDFFDKGAGHIRALKMEQIAEKVGVHTATVSRAARDKYMQTPRGILSLRSFFGGGTTTAEGTSVSWDTVKKMLREIVAREDKKHPFSDEALVDQFAERGIPVARRTVTKYRESLDIPSSRQRKQY